MHMINESKLKKITMGGEFNAYDEVEEVIENKYIVLTSNLSIVGKLTFCSCVIDTGDFSIESDDLFALENCEILG